MRKLYFSTKQFTISGLVIFLLLTVSACSIKSYKPITTTDEISINTINIFSADFVKALYKTDINIYGNKLTGITIIKKTDGAMRVVSMSELGLKYFDFEFPNNQEETIVHYIMEPLNKKALINLFNRDFSFLFYLPQISNSEILIKIDDKSNILVKHNKLLYFADNVGNVTDIKKQNVFHKSKPLISISGYHQSYPDTININHGKISLNFVRLKK